MRKNSVKRCVWLLLLYMAVVASHAQIMNPVHFSAELKQLDQATAEIVFSATIDEGWHVYSTDASQELPVNATFTAVKLEGAELVGKLKPRGDLKEQYDPIFDSTLRFFEHKAVFAQQIRFTQPQYDIDCYLEYYMVKNSWGETGEYKGTWYMTKTFIAANTMDFLINKNAIPAEIRKKLGI